MLVTVMRRTSTPLVLFGWLELPGDKSIRPKVHVHIRSLRNTISGTTLARASQPECGILVFIWPLGVRIMLKVFLRGVQWLVLRGASMCVCIYIYIYIHVHTYINMWGGVMQGSLELWSGRIYEVMEGSYRQEKPSEDSSHSLPRSWKIIRHLPKTATTIPNVETLQSGTLDAQGSEEPKARIVRKSTQS